MNNSSTICVDATIVTKLLVPSRSIDILQLWDDWRTTNTQFVAPQLIRYEITNVLYQMIRHKQIDYELAENAIGTMISLPIVLHHEEGLHEAALELAKRFGIKATYDAHYLALSDHLNCELWTTDKKFYNSVHCQLSWVHLVEI